MPTKSFASRASPRSYYEVLGVARTATEGEIKRAYLKEAKKYHPDVNPAPEAKERFQELGEAYYVLSNRSRRENYDSVGHQSYQAPPSGAGGASSSSGASDPGEPPIDPYELFRAVLEELGAEDAMRYLTTLQHEASHAVAQVKQGDLQPAREFAWKNKSLFVGVIVPAAVLLRSPWLVGVALRGVIGVAALLASNRQALELIGRYTWLRWRGLLARATQRARSKRRK